MGKNELREKLEDILISSNEQWGFLYGDARGMMKLYKEKGDEKGERRSAESLKRAEDTLDVIEAMKAHVDELTEAVGEWIK